jgi:hypothetical protein
MGVFNISSFFLLLPLLFINLNIIEILGLLTITCVSWLYHSNREMDAQVGLYLSGYTNNLYYIDRLQIQIGFTYILMSALGMPYDVQVLSYIYTIYNSQCNITLALLIIFNITNVIYRIILQDKENDVICFIIVSGLILAYIGYQGMPLSGDKHKITNWIEMKKIAWHGGMGLIASGLLINSKL